MITPVEVDKFVTALDFRPAGLPEVPGPPLGPRRQFPSSVIAQTRICGIVRPVGSPLWSHPKMESQCDAPRRPGTISANTRKHRAPGRPQPTRPDTLNPRRHENA